MYIYIYIYQFVDSLEFADVRFHIIYVSVQWSKLLARPLDNSNLFKDVFVYIRQSKLITLVICR